MLTPNAAAAVVRALWSSWAAGVAAAAGGGLFLCSAAAEDVTVVPATIALKASESDTGPTLQQVLVFDAGSSGTRLHVFDVYPGPSGAPVPRIDVLGSWNRTMKVKPGLSDFAKQGDMPGVERNIASLVEFACRFVPPARRSSTPALFKATAGLRALSEEEADAVLVQVRTVLAASEFWFNSAWASIIPGSVEAGLAWIAANYLNGTFAEGSDGGSARPPVGILEMGGGSTQVAFQVESFEGVPECDRFQFTTLDGRQYRMYAHSYLGYGQDHAQARLREMLPEASAKDPCYPPGYSRNSMRGAGSVEGCIKIIQQYLLAPARHTDAPGAYAGERALHGRFVATENFFYVRDSRSLPLKADEASMVKAAASACEQIIGDGGDDPRYPNHCFGLSYQVAFFRSIKAFSAPDVEIRIANDINGCSVQWALGAVVQWWTLVHALGGLDKAAVSTTSMSVGGSVLRGAPLRIGAGRGPVGEEPATVEWEAGYSEDDRKTLGAAGSPVLLTFLILLCLLRWRITSFDKRYMLSTAEHLA